MKNLSGLNYSENNIFLNKHEKEELITNDQWI
jgi:hypothetical protein